MLALKNIVKDYFVAGDPVHALKGVSINFRKNEFVSILGPSGCGKTTLLNIVGGLDRYTSGDLVINGKSTKLYKDKDWDVYRNHRVGFIFQSYNLIPHQTVLGNVELALTIAGISKKERIKKAKAALDRVGLKDQYNKRPNQLSGGQCQRVAIARALVNDPEILLADEPTGALDTVTSVQIMDLIKEISAERLVIMVTHNPELANEYSTRIVRLLDGEIIEDTKPLTDEEEVLEVAELNKVESAEFNALYQKAINGENVDKEIKAYEKKKKEKAQMSFFTAFLLSAKNLISKFGRTVMVGIAGSIGIIGIALVLAFSAGIKGYVASMQDDMLSGNPLTITEQTYDLNALTGMMDTGDKQEIIKEPNRVYINSMVEYFIKMGKKVDSLLIKNDITSDYISYVKDMPSEYYSAMKFGYGLNVHNNIYTSVLETGKTEETEVSVTALTAMYVELLKTTSFADYAQYVNMFVPEFSVAPNNVDYIRSQYEVYGNVAQNKNEIMLVINKEDELSDLLLARLGYYSQSEFMNVVYKADGSDLYNENLNVTSFSYDELRGKKMYWYPNGEVYSASGNPLTPFKYEPYGKSEFKENENAVELTVVGILKPKQNVSYGCLSSGIYYTNALAEHIINVSKNETGGLIDEVKKIDTSGNYATALMKTTLQYTLTYNADDGTTITPTTSNQTIMLASLGSMFSMMGSAEITAADVQNSALRALGGNDVANSVSIYPVDFDNKDLATDYLKKWNGNEDITVNGTVLTGEDRQNIEYTDTLSLVIDLINDMIDIVSYALIAFTSVSLVVSTVMIGIITYVSVVERIKEIGVIRSLGGRKKDVARLFKAETFIIGLLAGLIGIGATYLISAIVNAILFPLIGVEQIAALPVVEAVLLVVLSVVLTSISGLIPAKSAAKKDPVIALRSE